MQRSRNCLLPILKKQLLCPGQCSDSTPKDVRLMKHRAHVLHQQLKGFVQRRGHIVLKDSLPAKTEHVLFVRMTPIQRRLYRRFMEELITNRCVSNPLKAFAVCCKIWNHPDVLHNYLLKREEDDLDLLVADAECASSPAFLEAVSWGEPQWPFSGSWPKERLWPCAKWPRGSTCLLR